MNNLKLTKYQRAALEGIVAIVIVALIAVVLHGAAGDVAVHGVF